MRKTFLLLSTTALAVLLTGVVALAMTKSAEAAFAGLNGKIAFSSTRDGGGEIYTMNPDGSGVTRLTNDPRNDYGPAWSADGRKIAFHSDGEIHVMDADGSNRVQLTNNSVRDYSPTWSPDGSRIAFVRDLPAGTGQVLPKIHIMNADGSNEVRVLTEAWGSESSPDWSPDGSKIAFVGIGGRLGGTHIYTMSIDGSSLTPLTGKWTNTTTKDHPEWSPDGSKILYARFGQRAATPYDIMVMNADGTGKTNLTQSPAVHETHPVFSPDGRKIVFVTDKVFAPSEPQDFNHIEIWRMRTDGTKPVQLTNNTAADSAPDWQSIP